MELDSLKKTNVLTVHWSLSGICSHSLWEMQIPPSGLHALSLMGRFIRVGPVSLLIQVNCVSSHMHAFLLKAKPIFQRLAETVDRRINSFSHNVLCRMCPFLKRFRWIQLSTRRDLEMPINKMFAKVGNK